MSSYPNLSHLSPADHLLFDIGYSAGLLLNIKYLLETLAECDDYPLPVTEIIESIEEFQAGRLQLRSEIYDNAEEAARRGGAFEKVIDNSA